MKDNTLNIGGVPEHFNLPWHLAQEEGLFFDQDLSVNWTDVPEGTGAMVQKLKDGELDVAMLLTEGAVRAIASGLNARIVQYYVKSPLIWGIHTKATAVGDTMEDFKGKKYAISRKGSGSHLMAYVDAQQRNWHLEESQFNVINNLEGARESLANENSALFMWERFTTKPYVDNGEFKLVDTCPTPWPCFVMVVRNEVLINEADKIKKLQRVIYTACNHLSEDENAVKLIAERYGLEEVDVEEWFDVVSWASNNKVSKSVLNKITETLYDLKLIDKKLKPEELTHSGFTSLS